MAASGGSRTGARSTAVPALLRATGWSAIFLAGVVPLLTPVKSGGDVRNLADKLRFGPGVINHPVHVVPSISITIPDDWPLGTDGSIICMTCHASLPALTGGSGVHLRDFDLLQADKSSFCAKCHASDGKRGTTSLHWMAMRSAHILDETGPANRSGGFLDVPSRRCLGCHDGVNAMDGGAGGAHMGDKAQNHPVGVRYPGSRTEGTDTSYRPVYQLPREVRLPQGAVSCVSCHNVYSGTPSLLAVTLEGSALCFTCHQMD